MQKHIILTTIVNPFPWRQNNWEMFIFSSKMSNPSVIVLTGGEFTLPPPSLSPQTHDILLNARWAAGLHVEAEWRSGLTGLGPVDREAPVLHARPPCLPQHPSQACWGCCLCSQTSSPCHLPQRRPLTFLQLVRSPIKLRKTVNCGPEEKKINGTWVKFSKDPRAAHPPKSDGNMKGTRAKFSAQHIWTGEGWMIHLWHEMLVPGLKSRQNGLGRTYSTIFLFLHFCCVLFGLCFFVVVKKKNMQSRKILKDKYRAFSPKCEMFWITTSNWPNNPEVCLPPAHTHRK